MNEVLTQLFLFLDTQLFLKEGSNGLLLINSAGWGYVSSINWDSQSAGIACRDMGFRNAIAYDFASNSFNLTYPVNDVRCGRSNYNTIFDCTIQRYSRPYGNSLVSLTCRDCELLTGIKISKNYF